MTEDTARLIIAAGLGVGLLFWFIAVVLYRKIANAPANERVEAIVADKSPGEALKDLLSRSAAIWPQARLTRTAENRVTVTQSGIKVELEAVRRGSGAQLIAQIDAAAYNRRFAMGMAALVLIVMPAVVGGVPWALWNFVASSDSPSVRTQAVQVVQIVHVLWPPFLIYGLWRGIRRATVNGVSNALVLAETGI
jgi:hypothetical protein